MRAALPWLAQGDVFERVPLIVTECTESGNVTATISHGPALLLTHDCALDKTNRRAEVRVIRLFFLPLLSLSGATEDQKRELRRDRVQPSESLYVPDAGHFGESYCVLSEAFYLPARIFGLRLTEFDHREAEPGNLHLEATRHGQRVGRLDTDRLTLLRWKWTAYWTRQLPSDAVARRGE